MTILDTAKFCSMAPHSKKFAHMAKTAIESYKLFCSIRECYCENSLCECKGMGCDRNADPLSHIMYLGRGNMCDRCCAAMPAKYHMDSCQCEVCTTTLEGILMGNFKVTYHGDMSWVDSNKDTYTRRRMERCHATTFPPWNDREGE